MSGVSVICQSVKLVGEKIVATDNQDDEDIENQKDQINTIRNSGPRRIKPERGKRLHVHGKVLPLPSPRTWVPTSA